jgi:hypothetical protein
VLNTERLWIAAAGFLPICLTVATLAPIAGAAHLRPGIVVLGAAMCLSARHRAGQPRRASLLRIPAAAAGVALLATVFAWSLAAGDALFVALVFGSRLAGRFGPRAAGAGRAVLLPLTAMFIAPPVPMNHHPVATAGWIVLACAVAAAWTTAVPLLLPQPKARPGAVARAARAAVAHPDSDRRVRALHAAALALDARLSTEDEAARRALCEVEYQVDRLRTGAESGAVRAALARLGAPRTGVTRPAERAPASPGVYTRLAAQSATALVLAFAAGQLLFPVHWPWTVVTVITVSFGARSRGEVVVKSLQRLAGALAATSLVTPFAATVARQPGLAVLLILAILGTGLYLRQRSYVWWPAAMTSALALLYGLLGQGGDSTVLRERLLAIIVGGACAILPAALLAPIRTRDLVRKRTAECLRAMRDCLTAAPVSVAAVRAAEVALADLRTAAQPLLLTRRIRPTREAAWVAELSACAPALRALPFEPDSGRGIGEVLATVGRELRAAVAARRGTAARPMAAHAETAPDTEAARGVGDGAGAEGVRPGRRAARPRP